MQSKVRAVSSAGGALASFIHILAQLPGLGPRSAKRAALHLLKERHRLLDPLSEAITRVMEQVHTCDVCGNLDDGTRCHICTDPAREQTVLCVVEDVSDLWALERAQSFKGLYHVLGGTLSALEGRGPEDLEIETLLVRLAHWPAPGIQEIIFALSPTLEGQTTAHYVMDMLHRRGIRAQMSHLAYGIPMGGSLDYLDEGTLSAALQERRGYA